MNRCFDSGLLRCARKDGFNAMRCVQDDIFPPTSSCDLLLSTHFSEVKQFIYPRSCEPALAGEAIQEDF